MAQEVWCRRCAKSNALVLMSFQDKYILDGHNLEQRIS